MPLARQILVSFANNMAVQKLNASTQNTMLMTIHLHHLGFYSVWYVCTCFNDFESQLDINTMSKYILQPAHGHYPNCRNVSDSEATSSTLTEKFDLVKIRPAAKANEECK